MQEMAAQNFFDIPFAERNIADLVRRAASRFGSATFLRSGDTVISFGAFDKRVDAVARGLASLGVSKGVRVGLLMRNSFAFLELVFACAKLGAVYVPLNIDYKGDILCHQLNQSRTHVIVVDAEFSVHVQDVSEKCPVLRFGVVHSGDGLALPVSRSLRWLNYENMTAEAGPVNNVEVHPSDIFAINFTSGTTGPSKGVQATHCHVITFALDWIATCGFRPDDRLYTPLPMFHAIATWLGVLPSLIMGTEMAFAERFSASRFWDDVRRYGSTVVHGIFSIVPILLKQPARADDREVPARLFYIAQRNAEFEERFGLRIIELYGATETGIVTCVPSGEQAPPGSCGRPNEATYDVQIVDDDDLPVEAGVTGEIVVRPRLPFSMFAGYDGDPEATLAAWRNLWFHTGDNARRDEAGYFYFVDRKKDGIRRRGENIASFEVEVVLNRHPAVRESAVIARPSPLGEDDIHAVIVLQPDVILTAQDLWSFCETEMPRFWVPRYIEFRDSLPKTANQKVLKYLLRDEAESRFSFDREQGEQATGPRAGVPMPTEGR